MEKNSLSIYDENGLRSKIYTIRGFQVMLDFDLAKIYGYETKSFNRQVKNNVERFDEDFRFQLTDDEDICIQNHISRLRPKYENAIDNLFYYYILMYLKQKGLLNGKGVAITSLSAADLLSLQVPQPPRKEQDRIVQKIQEIEIIINTIITDL